MILNNSENNHEQWKICHNCGHEFDAHAWLSYKCPKCGYNNKSHENFAYMQRNRRI